MASKIGLLHQMTHFVRNIISACSFFLLACTASSFRLTAAGADQPAGAIDVRTLGVKGDGRTVDSNAINAALLSKNGANLYFPAGTYVLNNTGHPGMVVDGFKGSLSFASAAELVCTNATPTAQDCVNVTDETQLIVDGLHISYSNAHLPLDRAHPARHGMALRLWHVRNAKFSNIKIDGSTNVGLFIDESQNCTFSNVSLSNTSADGFSSVNSGPIELTNLTTKVTMDDGLSIIRYENKANYTGFKASDIHINDSAARGITVPGESNVSVANFAVANTCGPGVLILRDGYYHTTTPGDISFSHGTITGAGHYTNPQNPCKLSKRDGIGLQYTDTGDVSVDYLTITDSTGPAIAGSQGPNGPASGHVTLSHIDISGQNGGGVAIYNTKQLELSDISIDGADGGFFIAKNGTVKAKNLTTKNVKGYLNRSFDFEKNDSVEATNSHIIDTKPSPTGDIFVDTGNAKPSVYKGVTAEIQNGNLKMQAPTAKVVKAPNP